MIATAGVADAREHRADRPALRGVGSVPASSGSWLALSVGKRSGEQPRELPLTHAAGALQTLRERLDDVRIAQLDWKSRARAE